MLWIKPRLGFVAPNESPAFRRLRRCPISDVSRVTALATGCFRISSRRCRRSSSVPDTSECGSGRRRWGCRFRSRQALMAMLVGRLKGVSVSDFAPSLRDCDSYIGAHPGLRCTCPGLVSILPTGEERWRSSILPSGRETLAVFTAPSGRIMLVQDRDAGL
jgi:hypothetical protein